MGSLNKTFALLLVLVFIASSCLILERPVSGTSTVGNSWVEKAPMPTPRAGLGVAVVDNKIFAIGGTTEVIINGGGNSGGLTGANEEYNPSTDNWTTKAPMPTPRQTFAISVYQNKIYCIGGDNDPAGGYPTGTNEVYDPTTNTWTTKAPLPTPRFDLQSNIVNGKIYCIGGADSNGRESAVNEVYDPATNTWATEQSMPHATAMYASAVFNDKIVVFGGYTQIYDCKTGNWTFGKSPPESAPSIAVTTSGVMAPQRIYCFGDDGSNKIYDPENDSWTIGKGIPVANLVRFGSANVNDEIYVIGGEIETPAYPLIPFSDSTNDIASGANEQYTPIGYGTPDPNYVSEFVPPQISFFSPSNQTYNESSVPLVFAVNKNVTWTSYSLDGHQNVTITENTTIANISNGSHNLTVYSNDTYGNIGSQTVNFTVNKQQPFPTSIIIGSVVAIAMIVILSSSLLYRRHRNISNINQ